MKTQLLKGTLPAAIALLGLAGAASAQDDGCTTSTLHGDYGFTVSVQILNADGTITSRAGVGITHYDGAGNLTQTDYVMSLTPGHTPPGGIDTTPAFRTGETGTYTVNPDCTGSAEIDFPPHPGGLVVKLMFVLADHGRAVHTIVSSLIPPGAPGPVPVLIHSDSVKLGAVPIAANEAESAPPQGTNK